MTENCSNCRFAIVDSEYENEPAVEFLYRCRRYAPKPVVFKGSLGDDATTEWGWPIVWGREWCGEFKGINQ